MVRERRRSSRLAAMHSRNTGVLALVLFLAATGTAQDAVPGRATPGDADIVRMTLQHDLSSKLPNGSAFTAVDGAGTVYAGYIATKKAKWFHGLWSRGTIRLVFDEPMQIVSVGGKAVKKNGEAPARTGARVMQAAEIGAAYGVVKIVDDAYLDKPYGVGQSKAIPIDIAIGVGIAVVLPGPQAKLKAGTVIEAQRVAREPLLPAKSPSPPEK
jgi:hypothetical protein